MNQVIFLPSHIITTTCLTLEPFHHFSCVYTNQLYNHTSGSHKIQTASGKKFYWKMRVFEFIGDLWLNCKCVWIIGGKCKQLFEFKGVLIFLSNWVLEPTNKDKERWVVNWLYCECTTVYKHTSSVLLRDRLVIEHMT